MSRVLAGITISVDGFITGPGDGPGCGPGVGGERLRYWVFGGPWSYDSPERGEPAGADRAWLEETMGANGAVIAGRGTYEAAGHGGGKNPGASRCSWSLTAPQSSRRATTSSSPRASPGRSIRPRLQPAARWCI